MSSNHLPAQRTKPVSQFRNARLLPWIFAARTATVAALLLATGATHAAGPTQAELNNAANDSANWPYVDHDYRGQRYTPLDQITAKNAADLAQVCSYTFPDKEPSQNSRRKRHPSSPPSVNYKNVALPHARDIDLNQLSSRLAALLE